MQQEDGPPGNRTRWQISPRLIVLLIGGVAIGGIVCMAVTVLIIIFVGDL